MSPETAVLLAGLHSLGLALFHAGFWKLFGWPAGYRDCSTANRAIPQIANSCLIYFFAGIGALCLWLPDELLGTRLGRLLLAGMAGFWLLRTVLQFIHLPYRHPAIHALTVVFVLGALLFGWPLFR